MFPIVLGEWRVSSFVSYIFRIYNFIAFCTFASREQGEIGSCAREVQGDRPSDPAARAADHGHMVLER